MEPKSDGTSNWDKKKIPTSGFERAKIGTIIKKFDRRFRLSNKWQISINKCPYCKSKKTFHRERMKTMEAGFKKTGRLYENTIFDVRRICANTMVFYKFDLCLKCGRQWIIEVFCWELLGEGAFYFDFKTGESYNNSRKMIAKEIENKYKITVLNVRMDKECSLICICGHHAKDHKGEGTAGYCTKCGRVSDACHNFNPIG